jgi:dTMP kinase
MDARIAENLRGTFLVMDGPDGAGKTTQLDLLEHDLRQADLTVTRAVDPGGTETGQTIRDILLHNKDLQIHQLCETLLFMASRAQLVAELVRPATQAGHVVLCDRYISATLAYQGALGVDPQKIIDLGRIATEDLWPDLTVVLDIDAQRGIQRVGTGRSRLKRPRTAEGQLALFGDGDRLESRTGDYHDAVRRNFLDLPGHYPGPVTIVDAAGEPDDVAQRIQDALTLRFTND